MDMRKIRMSVALLALCACSFFFWSAIFCLMFASAELARNMAFASMLTAGFGIGTLIEEYMTLFFEQ